MKEAEASELLYSALGSRLGIVVRTNDFQGLKQKLYGTRSKLKDPALAGLQFRWWSEGEMEPDIDGKVPEFLAIVRIRRKQEAAA